MNKNTGNNDNKKNIKIILHMTEAVMPDGSAWERLPESPLSRVW